MNISHFKSASVLALATVALTWTTAAQAQQLDEIVVTAQKREENLQDVPISIAVFDQTMLENARIEGLENVGTFAPGLYVTPNPADNNGVRINIRGIGTFDPQIGQDSRVAIYQDGVYLGKTQGLAFDMPDLERVEILKGPQGTLYGRNTVAGAVNLVSARPSSDGFSGNISGELGNYGFKQVKGAVNIPLGDIGGLRFSGLYSDVDGWVENDGPGVDFGGSERQAFRAAFGLELSPKFRIDLAGDYALTNNEPLFYQSLTSSPSVGFFGAAIQNQDERQDSVTTSFTNEEGELETKGVTGIFTYDMAENHEIKLTAAYRGVDSSRFVTLVPTADPNIINAITGGFNQALNPLPFAFNAVGNPLRADWADQFPGTPNTGLFLSAPGGSATLDGHEQTSLDLTYNGSFGDGKFDVTAGGFYYKEKTGTDVNAQASLTDANSYLFVLGTFTPQVTPASTDQFFQTYIPNYPTTCLTTGGTGCLGPTPAALALLSFLQTGLAPLAFAELNGLTGANGVLTAQLASARQSAANDLTIDTDAYALYGQATWHISDKFRLTLGGRYSKEKKDGYGQTKSPFFLDNRDLFDNTIEPNTGKIDFDVFNPSVTAEYNFSQGFMGYASYKQSFRSGGFNAAAVGERLPGTTHGSDFLFGREDINAYEAGFKGDFMSGRWRLNAAGFYYDFKNKQTTVALNPLIATSRAVVNADDEIYGFEAETQFAVNDDLTLRASYTFLDGDAGDVTNPLTGAIEERDELQGTPKNSFLVGFDFNRDIGSRNTFFMSGNYSYKDGILSIPQNDLRLPSVGLVSGRIGMGFNTANGNEAYIALWGQNLFDEEYYIDSLPFETFAYRTAVFGEPRTYGATLGYKF